MLHRRLSQRTQTHSTPYNTLLTFAFFSFKYTFLFNLPKVGSIFVTGFFFLNESKLVDSQHSHTHNVIVLDILTSVVVVVVVSPFMYQAKGEDKKS